MLHMVSFSHFHLWRQLDFHFRRVSHQPFVQGLSVGSQSIYKSDGICNPSGNLWVCSGPLLNQTCSQYIWREVFRRYRDQIPEPPQLATYLLTYLIWKSNGSTPTSYWISSFLTLFLTQITLLAKHFSLLNFKNSSCKWMKSLKRPICPSICSTSNHRWAIFSDNRWGQYSDCGNTVWFPVLGQVLPDMPVHLDQG